MLTIYSKAVLYLESSNALSIIMKNTVKKLVVCVLFVNSIAAIQAQQSGTKKSDVVVVGDNQPQSDKKNSQVSRLAEECAKENKALFEEGRNFVYGDGEGRAEVIAQRKLDFLLANSDRIAKHREKQAVLAKNRAETAQVPTLAQADMVKNRTSNSDASRAQQSVIDDILKAEKAVTILDSK